MIIFNEKEIADVEWVGKEEFWGVINRKINVENEVIAPWFLYIAESGLMEWWGKLEEAKNSISGLRDVNQAHPIYRVPEKV